MRSASPANDEPRHGKSGRSGGKNHRPRRLPHRRAAVLLAACLLPVGCSNGNPSVDAAAGGSTERAGGAGGSQTLRDGGAGGTTTGNGGGGGSAMSRSGGATGNGGTTAPGGGSGGATGAGGSGPVDAAVPSTGGSQGNGGSTGAWACTSALAARVRITELDLGVPYAYNEVDNNGAALGLTPLAISPLPDGGSRVAFLGKDDGQAHVVTLDSSDHVVPGSLVGFPAYDFQDLHADAAGGVMLVSRTALGSTANNHCGDINNLCGLTSSYPTAAACFDMYLVRFDGAKESWATKLTDTSDTMPAYGNSATSGDWVIFIWSQYAHNGRIAFDGSNYAAYFGAAVTVPNQECVGSSTRARGVNIHQGDRMKVVRNDGTLQTGGFSWGCSHSGFERVLWDPVAKKLVAVCKNDAPTACKSGRLAFPPSTTIYPVDLAYANFGNVLMAGGGGYWLITSDVRPGQPANGNGLADVHLLHVPSTTTPTPDQDLVVSGNDKNARAPHLAPYGTGLLLAAWEESTAPGDLAQQDSKRQMVLQVLDATTGLPPADATAATAGPFAVTPNVLGSRYQDFRPFPDGSVAYPAPSTGTKLKILRVFPCR